MTSRERTDKTRNLEEERKVKNKRTKGNTKVKRRTENDRSDWIFERAKQRKDLRYEETRADWYFERKKLRDENKCLSDDCNSKPKGEKFVKEPHNYVKNHINERKFSKDQEKFKGEKKLNMQKSISVIIKTKTSRKNQRFTEVNLMVIF